MIWNRWALSPPTTRGPLLLPRSPVEEILVVLFQIFFEFLLQFFGSVPINFSFGSARAERRWGWLLLHAVVGGLLGALSTLLVPNLVLPYAALRIANLIVAPVLAGGIAYLFARWAKSRGHAFDPVAHFWHGVLFAFLFGAARFAFAQH